MSTYKGSNILQDNRFKNKEVYENLQLKYPSIFKVSIEINKVDLELLKFWIKAKVYEILKLFDDSLVDYLISILKYEVLNPNNFFVKLIHYFEKETENFIKALWEVMINSNNSFIGISKSLINIKLNQLRVEIEANEKKLKFFQKLINSCNNSNKQH